MGEALQKRKVVSFSATVKSNPVVEEQLGVNDLLLQAVLTASQSDEQFKNKLIGAVQALQFQET